MAEHKRKLLSLLRSPETETLRRLTNDIVTCVCGPIETAVDSVIKYSEMLHSERPV
jgi:hypothetical protein